ncbi:hypothetical protein [Sorangium sp. So ce341]|uniref:hypothetical protein n=1 Tax=Sorangium sp. So ce341 TaxID=3133302 RepID=UPI003F646744
MNDTMRRALDGALAGDPGILAGFGLERQTLSAPFWEERLSIDGAGRLRLRTNRSIADVSSEPIGAFSHDAGTEAVERLLRALLSLPRALPHRHVGLVDVRVLITVVAGGATHTVAVSREPDELAPLQPLLDELDRLSFVVRRSPVMSLELDASVDAPVRVSAGPLPVLLRFKNAGDTGFWITDPASFPPGDRAECCALLYGVRAQPQPGITPLPMEVRRADALPSRASPEGVGTLLWVPGRSSVERLIHAAVELNSPGLVAMRATWSSYAGDDTVGGRPRLRGCVFSNELSVSVG